MGAYEMYTYQYLYWQTALSQVCGGIIEMCVGQQGVKQAVSEMK